MSEDALQPSAPQGAVRLTDWGLLHAQGADARSFLHAQLTQDIASLEPGTARLAAWCSAKGRMVASFVVWATSPDDVWLACSADVLPETLRRLRMFVLRAKCTLRDASADWALWGVATPAATERAPVWSVQTSDEQMRVEMPPVAVRGVPLGRALLALPADRALDVDNWLTPPLWGAYEVRAGVPRITAATADRLVPQMANFELVGGVNFKKGCFPGQEVVARSQYRGTLKRRMFLLHGDAVMQPGQEVFHSEDPGQPAGLVVNAGAADGGRWEALVELKIAALDGGTLHLGEAGGPRLGRGALPYAVPLEALSD